MLKNKIMRIIIKEIKEDGSELLVYLVDDNDTPLSANIIPKEDKMLEIQRLIKNNTIDDTIKHMKYNNYIHQYMRYEKN